MTNQTIGQRIAEERKKLGISQVGLATRLDVSRQAISKWESDAAIPEIDKLISLSRLFGVSIGWLLGVEESEDLPDTLSDSQLRMVEELVKKYQQPPAPKLTAFHYMFAIAASLLIFLFFYSQTSRIESYLQSTAQDLGSLSARVYELEEQLKGQSPSGTLLASYAFDVEPISSSGEEPPRAGIHFSAIPTTWNSGDTGYLVLHHSTAESFRILCSWDGARLSADLETDPVNGYELCFLTEHENGTQEQQLLEDETIRFLQNNFTVFFSITHGKSAYSREVLTLTDFEVSFQYPPIYEILYPHQPIPGPALTGCDFILYRKSKGSAALEEFTCSILDNVQSTPYGEFSMKDHPIRFQGVPLENTESLQLWFSVKFADGVTEKALVTVLEPDGTGGFTNNYDS